MSGISSWFQWMLSNWFRITGYDWLTNYFANKQCGIDNDIVENQITRERRQYGMKRIFALIFCLLLLPCAAFSELTVYFIDVGQGDSALIVCDGESMIIDGGLPGNKVYSFIKDHNITRLEYMVATHPDEDHVGGLAGVLNCRAIFCQSFSFP